MKNFVQYLGIIVGCFSLTFMSCMFVAMLVTWEYPHYVLTSEDYIGWKVASTFISAIVAFWHGGSQIDRLMSLRKQEINQ